MSRWIGYLLALLLVFQGSAWAISWQGLTPARSSYSDATKVLGKPYQKHAVDNEVDMYSFKTKQSGDGKAHVFVIKKTQKIVAIAFVPPVKLSRSDIHKAFREPDEVMRDEDGNLIEYYGEPGLMINYEGDDQTVKLLLTLPPGKEKGKGKTPA